MIIIPTSNDGNHRIRFLDRKLPGISVKKNFYAKSTLAYLFPFLLFIILSSNRGIERIYKPGFVSCSSVYPFHSIRLSNVNTQIAEDAYVSDSIQKEYLISRKTRYEELTAIQESLSKDGYLFYIERFDYNDSNLVRIAGYVKHKQASSNNNFDAADFKTFKIIVNLDNKKGKIQLEFSRLN